MRPWFTVSRTLLPLLLGALLLTAPAVQAQRGGFRGGGGQRGGPGGFPGRGPGGFPGGELRSETTQQELGITDEQRQQIEEIFANQPDPREQFGDVFERMRAAETDEERQAIRDEMRQRGEAMREELEGKVREVLTESQAQRYEQIQLHRAGPRALTNDKLADDLKLTEAQRTQLQELLEKRDATRRESGRRMSDEERAAFDEEWNQKLLGVLTPDQKQQWQTRLGPPPAGEPARPGGPGGGFPAGPQPPPQRPRAIMVEAVPDGAESRASFQALEQGKFSFNFRYAPWVDVLKLFAEEAGLSLDLNALPPGTFNYYDQKQYTPTEALDVLNGYLLPKGYCLVQRNDFLVCVNIDEEIPPNLIPNISPNELDQRGHNELLTVVFPLEGAEVERIAAEIEAIKGPQGKVAPLTSTNSVLVTDIGSNLRRIRELLYDVTARGGPNDVSFRAYQVQFISAADAETVIRDLLGMQRGVTNVSASYERRSDSSRAGSSTSKSTQVTVDTRTNQLLVSATPAEHTLIEQTLKTIDVDAENSQFGPASDRPYFQVYAVSSSDAREVVKTIDALMPGIVVNEDGRSDKIHIYGTTTQHREVESLIRQMDGLGGSQQVAVIPLSRMDPLTATTTLRSMFLRDGEAAPTIEPDMYGRQLMVRGSSDQLMQIKTLLTQLGEDGSGQRQSGTGRIRSVPLSGRDPQEFVPLIEQMWNSRSDSPIRIVRPQDRGAVRDVRRPASTDEVRRTDERPPVREGARGPVERHPIEGGPNAARSSNASPYRSASLIRQIDDTDGDDADVSDNEQSPAQSTTTPADSDAPVTMTIVGDDLIITSPDSAKLDELEEMIASTMQAIPPRSSWTVFTLQSADATEAAAMLEQLFPNSSIGSTATSSSSGFFGGFGSSMSSFGNSMMEMTGLEGLSTTATTLRIIPEVRLNALFVSGPAGQVREVEQMLQVLDTNEWPESFRDRFPRMIPVKFADARDVYEVVKEVYSVYLEADRNNNNARGGAALAMLMGGGRGRGGSDDASGTPPAQLSISVDANTNNLIVWADESLFREIETLVESIDRAAEEARPTVRVVPLQNTNSAMMQATIGQLMPRVNVSTTGSTRSSTSGNNNAGSDNRSGGSPSGGGDDQDRIRRFFEQRMQERMRQMQGGGGGGPPGFGGPGGGFPGGRGGGGESRGPGGGGDRGGRGGRGGR